MKKQATPYMEEFPSWESLKNHLEKAKKDIAYYMQMTVGLAVIDWENWRPYLGRNGNLKMFTGMSLC